MEMKRVLCFIMVLVIMSGVAACSAQTTEKQTEPKAGSNTSTIEKQVKIKEQKLSPEEIAIADASTADELRALVERFKKEKNYNGVYLAAVKLTEIDPEYAPGYTDAASVLLEMSKSNYEKINSLLAKGCENAKDNSGYIAEWATQNEPGLKMKLPFIPDITSVDKINKVGITSGNSSNKINMDGSWKGGFLTSQGEWVYFSAPDENCAIYKIRSNGEKRERLGQDSGCFLNVVGDWIYYCNLSDNNRIYKMRTDGSEKTKIADDGCEFLSVSDEWIYYCNINDEGCLYRIKTDGSGRVKLVDTFVMTPCVSGEWVYYFAKKEGGFFRVRTDGRDKQRVTEQFVGMYCISDDWIYYIDGKDETTIGKMRVDGSEVNEVFRYDKKIATFNVAGGRIFASISDKAKGDKIIIVSMASLEIEKEFNKATEIMCIDGNDRLYYADYSEGRSWYRINVSKGETEKLR
jgi:hypothetical protein